MPSINPYARDILKKNIFKNINSFYELEKKIANSGDIGGRGVETTKGDIFEIFIEALLNVNKKYQKEKVFPSFATPSKIKNQLSLSLSKTEMGFDGVYENPKGISTYQVKYRNSDNGSLSWRELSTFIGVSEKAQYRHLFTNIDKISKEFIKKDRIIITSRKDLIKLKSFEFKEIENWLYQKTNTLKKHKPEAYQKEAINKISNELKQEDRTTAILACGTGKTNIALWVYEKFKPNISVVFVPSIGLIKQIRADWLEQTSLKKLETIQICSFKETSMREDELKLSRDDIDFETTTNRTEIRKFLKRKSTIPRIIFCTYQSSKVLAEASNKIKIDFGVFDEAHRTARISRRKKDELTGFNLPLYDEHLKINKRLFLTATRRISNPNKIYKTGDEEITLSMDNEELYGKICHSLSFSQAAKLGCIAKFKIILSYITKAELDNKLRNQSTTLVDKTEIKTDQVAKQIALEKAVKKFKINKAFTFHNTISRAKSFTSNSVEGVAHHLPSFYANSVDGEMKLHERENIMEKFKFSKQAIVSNARCLVEGVDVPSVEMVAFMDNKSSEIDIVQAAGRALRNRGIKKKYGYILIPVFIEQGKNEKIEDALKRTNLENVIQILRAMKEHDSEIAQIINENVFSQKKSKGFRDRKKSKIREIIEGDSSLISEKLLYENIITKSFEKVATHWDLMFEELKAHYNKYQNFNTNLNEHKKLHLWVRDLRRRFKKNQLFNFQIKQLEDIGFHWSRTDINLHDTNGLENITQLVKKTGLTHRIFNKLIEENKIKPEGYAEGAGPGGRILYFKEISRNKIKALLNISHFPKETVNLYTLSSLSKRLKVNQSLLKIYLKKFNIKHVATTINNSGVSKLYKDIDKDKFFLSLGITIRDTTNLLSKTDFLKSVIKGRELSVLRPYLDNNTIRPVGYNYAPGKGLTAYYKKMTLSQIERIIRKKIPLDKNLVTISYLAREYLNGNSNVVKVAIKEKKIIPIMYDLRGSPLFKKYNKEEFFNNLGVTLNNRKNAKTITNIFRELKKKYKFNVSYPVFKKLIIKNSNPVGKRYMNGVLTNYYMTPSKKELLKILEVDLLNTKDTLSQYGLKTHYDISLNMIKYFVKKGYFKKLGYAYTNASGKQIFYQALPKKELEKKANFKFDTKNLVVQSRLCKIIGKHHRTNYLIDKGYIKPICNGLSNSGIVPYFKKISKKEFEKISNDVAEAENIRMSYKDAKKFIKKFNLKTLRDWQKFTQSNDFPSGKIPVHPNRVYKKEWNSWPDFFN